MNEEAIKDAYDLFVNTGYNKSYDNFKALIQSNPNARKDAYDLFVGTGYNKTQKDFDQLMGIGEPVQVKKKEQVSLSQQKVQPTSSATGGAMEGGPSAPSVNPPSNKLQEELFQKTRLAASAVTASAKPGYTPVPKEEAQKALYGKAKVAPVALYLKSQGTKEEAVSNLNKDFGKLGVRFEQAQNPLAKSMGDVVATADNGQSITIQASDNERLAKIESEKLQNFLMNNSAGVEKKEVTPIDMLRMTQGGISEMEENKFKRVYTPEMINETVKFVNEEVTKSNKKLQDINNQIQQVNNEAARLSGIMGSATPEDQSKIKDLTDRYDLLISEFDREKNNAQVISRLGSEGINIAAGEHVKLLEKQGSFGKSIYNHTVNMIGDTVNGVFQLASLGVMDKGAAYAQDLTNQFKEDLKYAGTESYEENSNMAMKVLFSMPEWLPMAAMAPEVAMAFMFNQGVGRRMEEVNSNEETKNLSQAEKLAMVAPMAYIEAQLEKLGFGAWFNKNKGLASSIVLKAVSNVSPKAGVAGITKLINTEINNLAVKGLLNVSGAMLAEAETESLQYVTENAMRELYNVAEGRQIFKQPQFGSEAWAKELSDNAIMGAMGASFVSGPINIAQQTANYVVGKSNTNQTFGIVKDLLNDNVAESSMITQLNAAVNDGKITKEKAQNTLYNFREAKAIARDLPEGLSEDNQRAAFDLLAEKRKLTKQIEGKDPSLVDKQKKRITEIDNKLIEISNAVQEQTTSEVPVQPESRSGEEVQKGQPKAEPKIVAEEGQEKVVIPAGKRLFNEPNPETVEISKTYKEKNNIVEPEGVKIEAVDVDNASKIADAYEALQDSPNDPEVQDAYNAMADETAKQHQDIVDAGYEVEIWQGEGEPYANAQEMIDDVKNNKHMFIYSTEQGFGDAPITEEQRKQNKLLQDSGFKDKNDNPLLYNDLFRFVHDFFGHTERGNGFGPVGEENAWDVHARMYTPKARRAMTTETRGQNSWVNFGPQMRNAEGSLMKKGDQGYLSPKDRQFAPQKMALMPEEFSQITEVVSNFDQALANSAQSLNVVAPGLKVIVGENIDDVQNQIVEAIAPLIGERQAVQTAEEFATGTKGQTIFVDGKPFAVVFDKTTADSRTAGHEAWEVMLNDAFGNDQARFKEFSDSIDSQLRAQGFGDIADALDAFASQKGYEAVKYSEYMAELGGMLVEAGFGKGPLTAQQKTLLQKIGDIINKFAELFTGKKQFLDQATPEDILGFMVTISNKVAKGEDVASFFRKGEKAKATEGVTSRKQAEKIFTGEEKVPTFKSLPEIANWLEGWSKKNKIFAKDIKDVPDQEFVKKLESHTLKELAAWDGVRGQDYVSFYVGDIVDRLNPKLQKFAEARYGRMLTPGEVTLYHAVSGFASPQADPMFDSSKGLEIFDKYMNGGKPDLNKLSGYADKQATIYELNDKGKKVDTGKLKFDKEGNPVYSQVSMHYAVPSLNKMKAMISHFDGDVEKAMNWMTSIHSYEEISEVMGTPLKGSKALTPHENLSKEDGGFGIFGFTGAKLGSYILNRIGEYSTVTKDMWYARTMARLVGEPLTKDGKAITDPWAANTVAGVKKRKLTDQAWESVAKKLNITPSDVQERMWDFEKRLYEKMGAIEKASYASEGFMKTAKKLEPGLDLDTPTVESRSQKNVPAVVDEVLTDDGKGNYLFVHYSDDTRDVIKPMSGSKRNFTSREEVSAISSVGGLAMYYTKAGQKESGVGDVPHTVLVPKDKVYFYGSTEKGTVSHDPEGFEEEARQRFQAYRNRGNEDRPTKYAFDANNSAAWVTKVAAENGYDMLVTNWGGPKSYRAQTTKALKPEAEYTGFKKPDPVVFEVGDEIFVSGSYANVTSVNGSLVRYEGTNQYGNPTSGVFDTNRNSNVVMIEKAKPVVTVRAQKKDTYTNKQYGEMSENGVVFHGGTKAIDKLDPSKIKGGFRAIYGWGVYFAGTIYKASDYGDMITFLNSKALKFLKVNNDVTSGLISELGKIKDKNIYYDLFVDKLKNMVGIEINEARLRMGDFIRWDYNELWSQMFMDAGYDGFNQNDNEYVVFNIDKANQAILEDPLNVTTRSQKVEVKTIPGYDRMMNEVEGIMDKTINRGGSYNQASANAINYIQKSAAYERADDIQREQIIRDFKKIRGEKFKVAPSVAKILGQIEDVKKITVKESTALKDQIKLEAKAAKYSAAFVKQLRMDISGRLKSMVGRGMMSARQATAIISRYDKMNILNPVMRDRFIDYMSRVFQSAEYMDKIKEASKLRASIKKNMKSAANQAEIAKIAKDFVDIDPSRVESIDDYINNATQMLNAVARKTGDPLMRSLVNAADMASYIETEIESQREQIKNELLDKYKELVDAGVLSSDMTINEIKKVIAAIEQNDNEAVAKEEKAKEAVKEMMAEVSPLILQTVKTGEDPFTGEPISLTQDEKKSLIALTKIDTDSLSLSEALQVLEYANNFIANGITSGVDGMVSLYQGNLNAGELVDDGIKSIPLSKYFSNLVGRVWGEGFATLPMLNKLLWGNTRRAIMVSDKAGINGISNGKAKALKMVDTAVKQYVKQFSKVKDFLASENVVERGVFAFMSRNVIGDEFQVQEEFNRRKSLIEETIQALSDVNNSTDAEIKKGEVIQKVYDKVLKDAKNIDDVKKNVSKVNQDAVNWWINKWSENFDRLDEVSRNVYNTLLSRDINYTPDRFQMKEAPTATEEDFESGFFGNFEYVDTSKSGSLRQNNRIKTLPKDSNGVRKRIVNLDFDVNNVNALTSAMVDVETASSVMQLKGFATSKNFSKLFSNKEDKNLYKKRLIKYVNRVKGGSYVDQNELAKVNRFINTVASFGVAKALFSVSQPFKQFGPPMANTFVQTGRFDLNKLLYGGGMGFIDRSGYAVANRGVASQGELKSINRQLVEAEKNLAMRGLDGVAEFSNKSLEITLKYPDIFAARASWISFYLTKLKKQGVNISGIDLNTHELNKEAADYAQAMVDSQQNISDTDMQGEIFASKQPATVFLRRAILPLMTFTLNQKTRIWSDVRTLSNNVSSKDDKREAAKSLSGALVELVAFQGIVLAFKELYNVIAASIMGEDEDEEEKKIRKMRQSQSTAQAFMKDFFLPPIPGMDIVASKGINYLLDESGLSDELPGKWFDIQDEEQKYRLYDKMNQGYLNMLGTQGIAAEKALDLVDYYDAAIDGEFTKEYNGNKVKKALMEEDLDLARLNAILMTGYYGGLLPSDMANIVNIMNKKIQKRAEQVEGD